MLEYNPLRAYTVGEVVEFSGSGYQCIKDAAAGDAPPDATYWLLLTGGVQYLDILTDAEVGEVCPSLLWDPPDSGMIGLVYLPGGFMAGFKDRTIYFSEVSFPHAWPVSYQITISDDIVGLGVSGNTLAVMTDTVPYLISCQTPTTISISKLAAQQACVSKRSVMEMGGAIIYASQDGICTITENTVAVISDPFLSKNQWIDLLTTNSGTYSPTSVHIWSYDEFIMTSVPDENTGCFMFRPTDLRTALIEINEVVYGSYYDKEADSLYLIKDTPEGQRGLYLYQDGLDTSGEYREISWRSKEYYSPIPIKFNVSKVVADRYPVTLNIYANDSLVSSIAVTSAKAFWLPLLRKENQWSFEVVGSGNPMITEIMMSTNFNEL